MAIFPILQVESVVQVNDQTRLDATRSFITQDEAAITKIEIRPIATGNWIDVTDEKYLDWAYSTAENVTASCRITTDSTPVTSSSILTIVSEASDALFSNDVDLLAWEPDVLKYVRQGRNSFKDVHREAQKQVLDWFDSQAIRDKDGNRLTKTDIVDVQEVKEWSKFLTLQIINESLSNAVGDVFAEKSRKYESLAIKARNRSEFKLDLNNDGVASNGERVWTASVKVVRT